MSGFAAGQRFGGLPLQDTEPFGLLAPAMSPGTKEIARRAAALRNESSPSLPAGPRILGTQEEQIYDALAKAKVLTANIAMHLEEGWRRKLFAQLDSLHDPKEWEQGDQPVRPDSYSTFLKFILLLKPSVRPGLGLSSAGNLVAAWTQGRDRFTIDLLPRDRVRLVLVWHPNGEPERGALETSIDRLPEVLRPYKPEHWLQNANG